MRLALLGVRYDEHTITVGRPVNRIGQASCRQQANLVAIEDKRASLSQPLSPRLDAGVYFYFLAFFAFFFFTIASSYSPTSANQRSDLEPINGLNPFNSKSRDLFHTLVNKVEGPRTNEGFRHSLAPNTARRGITDGGGTNVRLPLSPSIGLSLQHSLQCSRRGSSKGLHQHILIKFIVICVIGRVITNQWVGTYRRGPQARDFVDLNCTLLRPELALLG